MTRKYDQITALRKEQRELRSKLDKVTVPEYEGLFVRLREITSELRNLGAFEDAAPVEP